MNVTRALHEQSRSIWLDNITPSTLDTGQIQHHIDQYSVTGLTSSPAIFDKAIGSGDYDDAIRAKAAGGRKGEELFFEPAIEELPRAADLFLPNHGRTDGAKPSVAVWSDLMEPLDLQSKAVA
ncbi:transaldolase family protein [Streptomyces sp. NPDC054813]